MPTVIVKRDSGYADSIRSYKVFLDGALLGKVAPGQSQSFNVSSGDHVIQAKIDWASTPPVPFRLEEKPVTFECYSKLRGPRLMAACFAMFNPRGWIGIKRLEDAAQREGSNQ
jgi:hypothetical protein